MNKLTPWFNGATQPPMRKGWYNLRRKGEKEFEKAYWNGESWQSDTGCHFGYFGYLEWQGVLK